MARFCSIQILLFALGTSRVRAQDVYIAAPASASEGLGLSQIISPSFAGMGIEPSNLYSFTGGQYNPNHLSINLLNNLANYTGVPPHLRIGGNTADNMKYLSSFGDYAVSLNPAPVGQGAFPTDEYWFGPHYFEVLDRFPANTPITYGLNLAYEESDYITQIVAQATAAITMLKNVDLVSFEIGNEPDLYLQNGFRTGTWRQDTYADQWRDRASAVYGQVLRPNGKSPAFFEPGCTASTIGTYFMINELADTVITAPVNGTVNDTYALGWNQHDYYYYIGVSGYALTLDMMMDFSTTPAQFSAWAIQAAQAAANGRPFYLREMSSVGPIGLTGVSDVFGATLWTFNFFLYTASLNVSSVQMHMTDNSFAAPWQPIPYYNTNAYVRTTYYAWAAFDQLIGTGCTTRVSQLTITTYPKGYDNRLTAYTSYQDNTLASLVLFNTLMSNASSAAKRNVTFNFSIPTYAGKVFYLSYLTNAGADSHFNTTWNGISYEISGNGNPTNVDGSHYTATVGADGTVAIPVRDSQAVVANLGSKLGSLPPSATAAAACQVFVASGVESSQLITFSAYSILTTTATGATSVVIATGSTPTVVSTASSSSTTPSSVSEGGVGPSAISPPLVVGGVALAALALL